MSISFKVVLTAVILIIYSIMAVKTTNIQDFYVLVAGGGIISVFIIWCFIPTKKQQTDTAYVVQSEDSYEIVPCYKCSHWEAYKKDTYSAKGLCHLNPPMITILNNKISALLPETKRDNWCSRAVLTNKEIVEHKPTWGNT
jgi:hypothetical protein